MDSRFDASECAVFQNIFHPTDLTRDSDVAFAHALQIALRCRAELSAYHVIVDKDKFSSKNFPSVRDFLAQWGVLPSGSQRQDVIKIGLRVKKIARPGDDPVRMILHHLKKSPADLVVLATHGRQGLRRGMQDAVAEPVARRAQAMTLFLPLGCRGFVDQNTGQVSLRNILIPVANKPSPQTAVTTAARLARLLGCEEVVFTLVHVGATQSMPAVNFEEAPGWEWRNSEVQGDVVTCLNAAIERHQADLVVMATAGRYGILDALRGSTTERILRDATCPMLAIPA